ncbi:Hpt domain-containing protein [Pedobacter foliorum]|uniref:Hpt domain-containing protein n=1 Tax=Pedobacter foliorum TaxID=2739058 RepID=UPI00156433ED|nr:Hpt domain-containing protein [Pedobacter foliorum]NRF40857.1 Hpt domain-containing protein [Pedobacter foliorum]
MINVNKNDEPLDLSYLREMSDDNAEFIIEMIDLFKVQTPVYLSELESAVADKNWPLVSTCAHKMKPTFSYVGREDAKLHMQMIEHNARELINVDDLPKACTEVAEFVQVLYKQLDLAKASLEKRL